MTSVATTLNQKTQELLQRQIAEGRQIGVQVCAYQHGQRVVDTWAGTMGPEDPRAVQADTLFSSFSNTKGVAATALHILADRGLIDYEAPVARYWPEFAANGKERITVSQAMTHQAGLHAMPADPAVARPLLTWENGLAWIANGVPAWEPGTATGYHALTYGWIVGGIIQGATGRHISEVIREEIARPLGVEDEMYMGIPDGLDERLASLKTGTPLEMPIAADHDFYKAMPTTLGWNFNDMEVRKACLPAANGHFTAGALARMYGALANGGQIDGVRLVSEGRIAQMRRIVTEDQDRVIMMPIPKGGGFMMGGNWAAGGKSGVFGPRRTAFGHSGAGGSTAFADPEVGLAVAVTINQMQSTLQAEGPTYEICELIRTEMGVD